MRKIIILILLFTLVPTTTLAEIKLYKAGIPVSFSEDMHCMNNETALEFFGKFKLCAKECEIKLNELESLKGLETLYLKEALVFQKEKYLKILEEKDKTIEKIYTSAITDFSDNDLSWWKVSLMVIGGVVIGAATTATVLHFTK